MIKVFTGEPLLRSARRTSTWNPESGRSVGSIWPLPLRSQATWPATLDAPCAWPTTITTGKAWRGSVGETRTPASLRMVEPRPTVESTRARNCTWARPPAFTVMPVELMIPGELAAGTKVTLPSPVALPVMYWRPCGSGSSTTACVSSMPPLLTSVIV